MSHFIFLKQIDCIIKIVFIYLYLKYKNQNNYFDQGARAFSICFADTAHKALTLTSEKIDIIFHLSLTKYST
jgi:hypothetical protein